MFFSFIYFLFATENANVAYYGVKSCRFHSDLFFFFFLLSANRFFIFYFYLNFSFFFCFAFLIWWNIALSIDDNEKELSRLISFHFLFLFICIKNPAYQFFLQLYVLFTPSFNHTSCLPSHDHYLALSNKWCQKISVFQMKYMIQESPDFQKQHRVFILSIFQWMLLLFFNI